MGLDQYAYSVAPIKQTNFDFVEDEYEPEQLEITTWRKHNRLQGWMERLWGDKGEPGSVGDSEFGSNFNCVDLEIDSEDLKDLEHAIVGKNLPETGGFFFGEDSYEEYESSEWGYKKRDMEFIEEAKKRLKLGHKVYYGSWW